MHSHWEFPWRVAEAEAGSIRIEAARAAIDAWDDEDTS